MQMQEPEQRQQWRAGQEYRGYGAEYSGAFESDQQQEDEAGLTANDYQGQKIYPRTRQSQRSQLLAILGIVFSSIGFFLTLAGIILSALVLQYSDGRQAWLMGGGIGLAASILVMLVCITIFVISVVWLAPRTRRARRRNSIRW